MLAFGSKIRRITDHSPVVQYDEHVLVVQTALDIKVPAIAAIHALSSMVWITFEAGIERLPTKFLSKGRGGSSREVFLPS